MSDMAGKTSVQGTVPPAARPDEGLFDFSTPGRRPRIGVLVNPFSGGNRSGLQAVRNIIADYPRVFACDVKTPQDVSAALVGFARQDVDLVAVNGGDGTVQAVLTALLHDRPFEKLPVLTVLQSGTTSMTARDVGIAGSRVKALRQLFHWARTGGGAPGIIKRPVLRVQAPGHPVRYGMFFGAAAIYQGIQYFHRKVKSRGLRGEVGPGLTILRYLWAVVRKNDNFTVSVPLTVKLDGQSSRHFDCLIVLVSTLERLFLGIHPYWGSENGPLHYTAVQTGPRHFLRALPTILRGRRGAFSTPPNGYFSHNATEIKLNLDSGFTLDGQLYTPENRQEPTVVQSGATVSFLRF
jgi:diacylglycerol kinase (ATP)